MNKYLAIPMPARRANLIVGLLIASAWGFLIIWQFSPYAELLGHESLGDHHFSFPVKLSAFVMSWFLMTVAMMLPASMPMLIHSVRTAGQPRRASFFLTSIIFGYLFPWVLFGLVAFLGDSVLHELTETGGPLAILSPWIAPSIAFASGIYQFTSIKWRCLQQCRPSHAMQNGMEMKNPANALREGIRLGFLCVGSCWSLMLLMFALGHHQLGWMFALSLVLAGERLTAWGRRIAWIVGSILLISAVFLQLTV